MQERVYKDKKIKICHVIGDFVNGGVESIIYNYFTHMDLSKFEIHIIAHGIKVYDCYERFEKLGFKIYNITPKQKSFIKNVIEMDNIIKKNKYNIIHSHLTEWSFLPMMIGKLNKVQVRINHSHMAEFPTGLVNKMYYGIRKYLGKVFATDYFACGIDAGVYLFGKKSYDEGKIKVINNAIDASKFQYNEEIRDTIRKELNIGNKICIGNVGRFFEQKNHGFLIDIFNEIHKIDSNTVLMLVGDGKLRGDIEKKIEEYALQNNVLLLGVRKDADRLYQAMDVFVLPSLFEGLPVVAIEAQMSGLPCVVSDKITKEICITDSIKMLSLNITLVEWAKIILGLSSIERIGVESKNLKKYDININAKKLEQFYEMHGGYTYE